MSSSSSQYTARHRSLLRAVSQGRGRLTCSQHPDLAVDGLWCDHIATSELIQAGLIRQTCPGVAGTLVPAVLTSAGSAVLDAMLVAA